MGLDAATMRRDCNATPCKLPPALCACYHSQVFVHVRTLAQNGDEVLHSTRAEDGGSGQPLAFRLCKGWRAPRGWELALLGSWAVAGLAAVAERQLYGGRLMAGADLQNPV